MFRYVLIVGELGNKDKRCTSGGAATDNTFPGQRASKRRGLVCSESVKLESHGRGHQRLISKSVASSLDRWMNFSVESEKHV
ncbi:hypothetical protein KM043_004057 [Ampulex compressa]|nr:hypothetical protein KM043_004057 [Ampulex compressa]